MISRSAGVKLRFSTRRLIFFFSSRRRHTICGRDWSSDVCSSDLLEPDELAALVVESERAWQALGTTRIGPTEAEQERSEERRVGKESARLGWRRPLNKNVGVLRVELLKCERHDQQISRREIAIFNQATDFFFFEQKTAYDMRT